VQPESGNAHCPMVLTCVKTLAPQQQESKAGLQWIFPFVFFFFKNKKLASQKL
jgi:hypothetical protein